MKLRTIVVALFISILSIQSFAHDRELAVEVSKVMLPLDYQMLYKTLASDTSSLAQDLTRYGLSTEEQKQYATRIKKMYYSVAFEAVIASRQEIFSEKELQAMLDFYSTKMGQDILNTYVLAAKKDEYIPKRAHKLLNPQQRVYYNQHVSRALKSADKKYPYVLIFTGKKMIKAADTLGLEVAKMTADVLQSKERENG